VPCLYLCTNSAADNIAAAAREGAHVVVTYFSGLVDEHDHVRLGGYPGAFRELLGVRSEEFYPLGPDESARLDDGSAVSVWTELLHLEGADAVASYADGPTAGVPAITRHAVGHGAAWYVATRLETTALARFVQRVVEEAGVEAVLDAPSGVDTVRREGDGRSFLFVFNHTGQAVTIRASGLEVRENVPVDGSMTLPAGGCAVIRER
jgi:beta-galactosidase